MLVPVVVVGLLFLYAKIDEMTRYDPAFFTEEFRDIYHSPGMVAIALEPILREGDVDSIRELLGTRRSLKRIEARPDLILVFLLEADEKYFHYLFLTQVITTASCNILRSGMAVMSSPEWICTTTWTAGNGKLSPILSQPVIRRYSG